MASMIFLIAACFAAAFIDAIAGGGGLISLPAYLIAGFPPHMALGTNKFSSSWGSLFATAKFAKDRKIDFSLIKFMIPMSFIGAVLGVKSVLLIDQSFLGPVVMVLILFVGIYTIFSKSLGKVNQYSGATRKSAAAGMLLAFALGFYDGFFGPGTGSFLIFLFIRFFGFDFLHASAASKVVNVATNLAAIGYFVPNGFFLPLAAAVMATANIAGSFVGTHLALRHGSGFVRRVFLAVVGVLIVKFAWDTF